MAFAVAAVVTSVGKSLVAKQVSGNTTNPPKYIAYGTGSTAAAHTAVIGDTALKTEVETRGLCTLTLATTSVTNDSVVWVGTPVAATIARSVDEYGIFDASTVGNMFFSGTQTVQPLQIGDSITYTITVQWL